MTRNPRGAYDENGNEIPPMTLGSMRDHGVRSVDAFCEAIGCGHEATLNVARATGIQTNPYPAAVK
jgi:hypothetical protein